MCFRIVLCVTLCVVLSCFVSKSVSDLPHSYWFNFRYKPETTSCCEKGLQFVMLKYELSNGLSCRGQSRGWKWMWPELEEELSSSRHAWWNSHSRFQCVNLCRCSVLSILSCFVKPCSLNVLASILNVRGCLALFFFTHVLMILVHFNWSH